MNGDGLDDLVFAEPFYDGHHPDGGMARVYSGATPWGLLAGIAGGPGSQTGFALADAGDLDGDGIADLLVGQPGMQFSGQGAYRDRSNAFVPSPTPNACFTSRNSCKFCSNSSRSSCRI